MSKHSALICAYQRTIKGATCCSIYTPMQRSLNIISGYLPCPNTLGDAQQTYWLIGALSGSGVQVHLFTFSDSDSKINTATTAQLSKICSSVKTYAINQGHRNFSFSAPYATSRYLNNQLINDLKENNFPILIEGLGPSELALSSALANKNIWVRLLTLSLIHI